MMDVNKIARPFRRDGARSERCGVREGAFDLQRCCRDQTVGDRGATATNRTKHTSRYAPRGTTLGFQRIRLTFELDTSADDEQLANLLRLTERYCVVLQTLRAGPEVTVSTVT